MKNKIFAIFTGLAFGAVLLIVLILNLVLPNKTFSTEENRMLASFPVFSLNNYLDGRFESKIDSYANDQFLFRNGFIKMKTSADLTLGKVDSNKVYNCHDDYLMEEITEPKQEVIDKTTKSMEEFYKKHRNLKMYFLLAPNAANILKDKLPAFVQTNDQNQYMDDFFGKIEKNYKIVDVRDTFNKAKDKKQLYYRTDHHWTSDGAYIAYKKAAKVMGLDSKIKYKEYVVKNDFKGTLTSKSGIVNGKDDAIKIFLSDDKQYKNSVMFYSDTKKKTTKFYRLKNLDQKDAYTVFGGSNSPMYTIKTPVKSKKKLLLIKDSYANSFIPFLSQDFRKIVVVDPRYFYDSIDDIIKSEEITDILFLYNGNTFFQDDSLEMMISN